MEEQNDILEGDDIEAFKRELQKGRRIRGIIISVIPAAVIAIMWIIIIIANTVSVARRDSDKFDITVSDIGFESPSYFTFDVEIKNGSAFDINHIDMRISFYDSEETELGYIDTFSSDTIKSGDSRAYSASMRGAKMNQDLYRRLWESEQASGLSGISVRAEATAASFLDGKSVSYPERWFGGLYFILLGACIGGLGGWAGYIFVNTYCKSCHAVLAVKTVGRRVISEQGSSWLEQRQVKNKRGEVVLTYDERVSGTEMQCEYKRKCSCCGHISYRKGTERHRS